METRAGRTGPLEAAATGNCGLMEIFPPGTATWDYENSNGKTALMESCENEQAATASFLVATGATVDYETKKEAGHGVHGSPLAP